MSSDTYSQNIFFWRQQPLVKREAARQEQIKGNNSGSQINSNPPYCGNVHVHGEMPSLPHPPLPSSSSWSGWTWSKHDQVGTQFQSDLTCRVSRIQTAHSRCPQSWSRPTQTSGLSWRTLPVADPSWRSLPSASTCLLLSKASPTPEPIEVIILGALHRRLSQRYVNSRLPDLHHKSAKSFSPVPLLHLDLITVNNLMHRKLESSHGWMKIMETSSS